MLPVNVPFMKAIKADPENDQSRLFYADWLEENGETDYANFIRLSLMYATAEAKLGKPSKDERFPDMWLFGQRAGYCRELKTFEAITGKKVHDYECPLCLGRRVADELKRLPEYIRTPEGCANAIFHRGFIQQVTLKNDRNIKTFLCPILDRNPVTLVLCDNIRGVRYDAVWRDDRRAAVSVLSPWWEKLRQMLGVEETRELRFASLKNFQEVFSKLLLTQYG